MLKITLAMISIQMCLYKRSVYEEKLTDIFPQRLSNDKSFFCQQLLATPPFYLREWMQREQEAEASVTCHSFAAHGGLQVLGDLETFCFLTQTELSMSRWVRSINGMAGLEAVSLSGNVILLCSADVLPAGQGGSHTASWPFLHVHWTLLPFPEAARSSWAHHTCICPCMFENQQSPQDLCPSQGSLGPLLEHCMA